MNRAMPAIVFLNPSAGGGGAARKTARVREAFAKKNYPIELSETVSAADFQARARAAIDGGRQTLIAMGGDGTLQLLVREAIGHDVKVGVIPVGGGNDFAVAVGIGRKLEDAVETIVRGRTREVDVVSAKFANGEGAIYVGGGGVGLDVEAVKLASGRFRNWPGRLRYVASAITALRGFAGVNVKIEFPGSELSRIEKKVLVAVAMNTATFGGGLRLAPKADLDDGLLEMVLLEMLTAREVLALLPRLVLTGELRAKPICKVRVGKVSLSAGEGCWFQGDGELLGKVPVEIEVLAKALRVIVP